MTAGAVEYALVVLRVVALATCKKTGSLCMCTCMVDEAGGPMVDYIGWLRLAERKRWACAFGEGARASSGSGMSDFCLV